MSTAATDSSAERYLGLPIDDASRERLAERGLGYRLVDDAAYGDWLQSVVRGFLDSERTAEQIAASRERSDHRRMTGVYDDTSPMPELPVGTIASWPALLSVPGGAVPTAAISAVTVAQTHHRRGIARAMLEGELRTARAAGLPLASLTVSEATLYGRYGFAPAVAAASWRIDTTRASWIGPRPDGRVDFITRERARALLPEVHDRWRAGVVGEIDVAAGVWDNIAATRPDAEKARDRRAVQYSDAAGIVRGVAVYTVRENDEDMARATATIGYLLAEGADAYAALWRFFLELDLVGELRVSELSVDEPLLWMISDQRAVQVTIRDHHYVRVLDVAGVLEARRFGADGAVVLDVSDPLDIVTGRWLLRVVDGCGTVTPAGDASSDTDEVSLGVEELSAICLGAVSPATLATAGRVRSSGSVDLVARMFGWHVAPRLSIWY